MDVENINIKKVQKQEKTIPSVAGEDHAVSEKLPTLTGRAKVMRSIFR